MTENRPIMPGDRVKFIGSGWCSALIGGPGEVVSINKTYAEVRVLTAGECLGNRFKRGEVLIFGLKSLAHADTAPSVGGAA